jgi:hypothetical protein
VKQRIIRKRNNLRSPESLTELLRSAVVSGMPPIPSSPDAIIFVIDIENRNRLERMIKCETKVRGNTEHEVHTRPELRRIRAR